MTQGSSNDPASNVIALRGGPVPASGVPNPALIGVLEEALSRARTGELQFFAGTGFTHTGDRFVGAAGVVTDLTATIGAITMLGYEIREDALAQSDNIGA
jgi:hypothetical protein